jgi:hypothetical protein
MLAWRACSAALRKCMAYSTCCTAHDTRNTDARRHTKRARCQVERSVWSASTRECEAGSTNVFQRFSWGKYQKCIFKSLFLFIHSVQKWYILKWYFLGKQNNAQNIANVFTGHTKKMKIQNIILILTNEHSTNTNTIFAYLRILYSECNTIAVFLHICARSTHTNLYFAHASSSSSG